MAPKGRKTRSDVSRSSLYGFTSTEKATPRLCEFEKVYSNHATAVWYKSRGMACLGERVYHILFTVSIYVVIFYSRLWRQNYVCKSYCLFILRSHERRETNTQISQHDTAHRKGHLQHICLDKFPKKNKLAARSRTLVEARLKVRLTECEAHTT
jgi:hypothetical protein